MVIIIISEEWLKPEPRLCFLEINGRFGYNDKTFSCLAFWQLIEPKRHRVISTFTWACGTGVCAGLFHWEWPLKWMQGFPGDITNHKLVRGSKQGRYGRLSLLTEGRVKGCKCTMKEKNRKWLRNGYFYWSEWCITAITSYPVEMAHQTDTDKAIMKLESSSWMNFVYVCVSV